MSAFPPTHDHDRDYRSITARATARGMEAMERGWLPDAAVRAAIRRLCRQRLARETAGDCEARLERRRAFIASMDAGPIAPVPEAANAQHYELPPAFFEQVLGHRGKYSGCWFDAPDHPIAALDPDALDRAEDAALAVTCDHAELADGQRVLELGCGWGSLTFWMAEHYPASRITAVSNSATQRAHIERLAAARGLGNIRVVTADMNTFAPDDAPFDRVVSVEMFEHMRNWRALLARIAGWLVPGGRLLIHVFCHREMVYPFATDRATDWMGRHFFTGGIMPAEDLPLAFQDDLRAIGRWRWNGRHYAATANAWLANLDRHREVLRPLLEATHGTEADRWYRRWRVFFMACAELFALNGGDEWWVVHHLLAKPGHG